MIKMKMFVLIVLIIVLMFSFFGFFIKSKLFYIEKFFRFYY